MKALKKSILLLFVFSGTHLYSQQITTLEIYKPVDQANDVPRLRLELYIPMDLTNFEINNPIDQNNTIISLFTDNNGFDLLEKHQETMKVQEANGYGGDRTMVNFAGIGDYSSEKDIRLSIELGASPSIGAQRLLVEGKISLNFVKDGSEKTAVLKKIPVEMPYGSEGVKTPIGLIRIESSGSMSMDDLSFYNFRVVGMDNPITSAVAIGGEKDLAELLALGMGIDGDEIVFKEVPETVDLEVTYSSFEKVEVPLSLDFSVGL